MSQASENLFSEIPQKKPGARTYSSAKGRRKTGNAEAPNYLQNGALLS